MPKTMGRSTHHLWVHSPSLGSPNYYWVHIKKIQGASSDLVQGGYFPPPRKPRERGGGWGGGGEGRVPPPRVIPPLHMEKCTMRGISRVNNITHIQHYTTSCFLSIQGVTIKLSHWSRSATPIVSLHQENLSVLTDFVNESATFFKVSTFTNNSFFSSTISLTK